MPVVRRPDLLAEQRACSPYGQRVFSPEEPPVRVGATGSGADLALLAWSANDLAGEIAAGARLLGRLGIRPGLRVANTLPGALVTPGALLLGDVDEAIGALDVPLGVVDGAAAARAAWELFDRVVCNVLVLEPANAAPLLDAAPARARPAWAGVIWLCRGPGVTTPPALPAGFGGWQREWLAVPEVTSFVAGSCAQGRQHVDEGVQADVVDGELVLAAAGDAERRYATGLRATVEAACACGAGRAFAL